ncbi:dynactin subunit 4 [Mariannaea sp. PMI_226]|nr:dynactin subunit 4 [Mariannaea sp. PMI_226]
MAPVIPYTYIQCPCSDISAVELTTSTDSLETAENEERTFNPRAPRSNYSFYPLEHLLYCEDCQQIRCPRCVNEEIVTYYCPHCLFEVPSSNVRSEGNRCTRSCFQCPICIAPLQSVSLGPTQDASHLTAEGTLNHTYSLFCPYCNWNSTNVGIEFDRPSGIYSQLAKIKNGGERKLTTKELKERRKENPDEPPIPDDQLDADLQFSSLKSFYQTQLANTNASFSSMPFDNVGFSSPAALSRIMSLYTGHGHAGRKRQGPSDVMREALTTEEGLKVADLDESTSVKQLQQTSWDEVTSTQQNMEQADPVRFQDQLRPIPYLLRTKRSKRCSVCRHIISKPENKVQSTRFKIRLVAKSYIPNITIRPVNPTALPVPTTSRPQIQEEALLEPHKTYHYILTFKNPLFDNIKVSLATPYTTPGRFSSKVTVLCPQFEVDANTDMWDDALKDDERDRRRKGEDGSNQLEAGKIWERGRNWVSIILEVVPSSLRIGDLAPDQEDRSPLKEDEDILEIPMFVRMEWEADAQQDVGSALGKDKEGKEKRELAYWCVLGVGRIRKD